MPERKNHQDSKECGGLPLHFKMSIPTFYISSDQEAAAATIRGNAYSLLLKKIEVKSFFEIVSSWIFVAIPMRFVGLKNRYLCFISNESG